MDRDTILDSYRDSKISRYTAIAQLEAINYSPREARMLTADVLRYKAWTMGIN